MPEFYVPPKESKGGWRVLEYEDDIKSIGLDFDAIRHFAEWNMSVQTTPPAQPSSVSFLVIKNGWLVYEMYDRPETQTRTTWTASIGKSMSACMVGRWIEEGASGRLPVKIDLESPIYDSRYLPEGFPLSDSRKKSITLAHVLTHTSGLKPSPETFRGDGFSFVRYTVGNSESFTDSQQLVFDPGTSYGYSNVGYNHLAIISPHLTGNMFHQSIENELFLPIGIEGCSWYRGGNEYFWREKLYQPSCAGPDLTARDLSRFAYLLLNNGNWGDQQIISRWYLTEMKKVHFLNDAQPKDYGFGLRTNINGTLSLTLPKDAFVLTGSGLNIALIVPSLDLIVLRMSQVNTYNNKLFLKEFLEKTESILQ